MSCSSRAMRVRSAATASRAAMSRSRRIRRRRLNVMRPSVAGMPTPTSTPTRISAQLIPPARTGSPIEDVVIPAATARKSRTGRRRSRSRYAAAVYTAITRGSHCAGSYPKSENAATAAPTTIATTSGARRRHASGRHAAITRTVPSRRSSWFWGACAVTNAPTLARTTTSVSSPSQIRWSTLRRRSNSPTSTTRTVAGRYADVVIPEDDQSVPLATTRGRQRSAPARCGVAMGTAKACRTPPPAIDA